MKEKLPRRNYGYFDYGIHREPRLETERRHLTEARIQQEIQDGIINPRTIRTRRSIMRELNQVFIPIANRITRAIHRTHQNPPPVTNATPDLTIIPQNHSSHETSQPNNP